MQRLDLVYVHLRRGSPIVGEMVSRGEDNISLHVIYGPRNKIGQMIRVPLESLQSYKVSSHQLKGAFPQGTMPQELMEKGEAYLITDKPTMYPDFTGYGHNTASQSSVANRDGMLTRDDLKAMVPGQSADQNKNTVLAQDILDAGSSDETPDEPGYPVTFNMRRRYGNAGV